MRKNVSWSQQVKSVTVRVDVMLSRTSEFKLKKALPGVPMQIVILGFLTSWQS